MKPTGIFGRFKSIQNSIFVAISILVLFAVVIVTAVSLRYTRNAIFENSSVYTETIIRQMNQNIDSYIDYMENISSVVAENEDVKEYLFTEHTNAECVRRIQEQFRTILKGRDDIKNLGIVYGNEKALINASGQKVNEDIDVTKLAWYQNAIDGSGKSVLTSSHVQHIVDGERPWVITLSRRIDGRDDAGNDRTGVFFIDLNYSAIRKLCDQNNIGDKGYAFILDANGNIVYHPQQQQLYNELQTENMDIIMEAEEGSGLAESGENGKLYVVSRSDQTDWTVVGCINMNQLMKKTKDAQGIYVLTAVLLVVIALLLSGFISKTITLPIQKLRDSMAKVQVGDFQSADLEVPSENEIGSLTTSFNVMTHRIEELMEQNVHEQEEKRKSELKVLQSQINPHFLYNTLDSIIWMAEGKKNQEVVLMTSSLAKLLRQSISNEDEVVSVAMEIEYVRSYLTIQKMRYKDKLEYEIQVDDKVKHSQIIKLVLQPLVENAIYHGLKYKESKGMLSLHGYEKGQDIVIEIQDDGVGMDEATLKHIFERHKVNYRSNGVGVYNVQKRLQLYYGADYGITYHSKAGKGTTAIVTIPKNRGDNHEAI